MRRTLTDWLEEARKAANPGEVDAHLASAMAAARTMGDWLSILRVLAEPLAGPLLGRRAELERALSNAFELAVTEREVWGFRDVARVRCELLGDPDTARAALEAGERVFAADETPPYVWALLARGYVETLDDAVGAARCLASGAAVARAARDADGFCSIATATFSLDTAVDAASARALLHEAEALDDDDDDVWSIANAWHGFGDVMDAARVLDAALARARTVEAAIRVANAWASHQMAAPARRAALLAETLATTFDEWMEIAEEAFDLKLGDDLLRRALERAEPLAADDNGKLAVASAYMLWLRDRAAADRIGPRGTRPAALRRAARTLDGFTGSAAALFDWARARISPEGLSRVAEADYGTDAERHLASLKDICESGLVPRSLDWHPGEVVELYRWHSGASTDHVARILCCAILTIGKPDDELGNTGALLVESALALGGEAPELAEQLLAWRCETDACEDPAASDDDDDDDGDDDDDDAEPAALVLLAILIAARDPRDPRVAALASALEHHSFGTPRAYAELRTGSVVPALWEHLIQTVLVPAAIEPAVRKLLDLVRS